MNNSHHNTTNESGSALDKLEAKAKRQEWKILELFKATKEPLTRSDIYSLMNGTISVDSSGRALSNLTRWGYLEKTNRKNMGLFGSPNYFYKLSENYDSVKPVRINQKKLAEYWEAQYYELKNSTNEVNEDYERNLFNLRAELSSTKRYLYVQQKGRESDSVALKNFQQLEINFAELSGKNLDLAANLVVMEEINDVVTKSNEILRFDNSKLKEAVDVCHEQIEKRRIQIIQKDLEIDRLYKRIDELTKVKK